MNLQPTQIPAIWIEITHDEARAILVDAREFQAFLRAALGEEVRTHAGPHPWRNGKTAKAASANGASSPPRGEKRAENTCQYCGKQFVTEGRYRNHLRDVHAEEQNEN